jgi:ABC-type transport system involved in multi-copper enzyme maturation permease subunit
MIFGLGPVLRYELITTARRGRYYLARVVYGSALLLLLWGQFREWEFYHPLGATPEALHQFAESTFIAFAGTQFRALLVLLPALVAGVIADEHQRKTLHYLLASRLSSPEIVLGKLGARLLHVGTFVALGLPVVSLLALYGGLDPWRVFSIYSTTFTTVLSVAGLSILVSVLARRPRDAILAAYALEAIWLLGPPAAEEIVKYCDGPLGWAWPVCILLIVTNPLIVLDRMTSGYGYWPGWEFFDDWLPGVTASQAAFWLMVVIQTFAGLFFLVLAIAGLRPLRGSSWPGAEPKTGWWTRLRARAESLARHRTAAAVARNELLASRIRRPACGDAPMLWKERYTTLGGGLRWLGGRPFVLFCGVLMGCYLFDVAYPELAGMFRGRRDDWNLQQINRALRSATTALSALGLLAIAAASAVAITGEREQDTWLSLSTTLLTPGEVIRAKQFGALWTGLRVGLALLITWAVGILLGAIHPSSVWLAAEVAAVGAWFAATVGVFASVTARNSTRALVATFISLLLLLGSWPFWISGALFSPGEVAALQSRVSPPGARMPALTPAGLTVVAVLTAAYAGCAGALTAWSIRKLSRTWGGAYSSGRAG